MTDLQAIDKYELKEKIKAHITKHPELFDMQHIGMFKPGTYKIDLTKRACIAGITLGILEIDFNPQNGATRVAAITIARDILGLNGIELFLLTGWDPDSRDKYLEGTPEEKAKLACEQIDKFIQ